MAPIGMMIAVMQARWWCPMCGSYGMGGWGMMFMGVIWLVVIGALIWLIARYVGRRGGGNVGGDTAEAILRERYARGEIDEATYRGMLEELRQAR